ncbi:transcription initiation factor TFIID subunit 8-like [Tubulanus polymorphus]|uniref:transcription initiation factor TFIID subunit 8-like n=1 Tax=Tubulanus polymorphus TaxID=672921 RepID=UPI003DA3649B
MTSKEANYAASRRHVLKSCVAALCSEIGFNSIEPAACETLVEIMQSFMIQLATSGHNFCEHAGRTKPLLGDVVLSLIEMGFSVESLPAYAKRTNKMMLLPPAMKSDTGQHRILQTGQRKSHPSHIPDYLPEFPDPHTYIKTPTHKQPLNEYQVIREKIASQKRDVEKGLTRFIAKTGETHCLFDEDNSFPLIANKPLAIPYLHALLPRDQNQNETDSTDESAADRDEKEQQQKQSTAAAASEMRSDADTSKSFIDAENADADLMDNPYLRPVQLPRTRATVKRKYPMTSII